MLRVAEQTDQRIYFELDRFERCADDRLAVTGRWYGVRGRRFVRPTLSLRTGRGRCRALADLEHKPWAAEDGAPWRADFRLDDDATELLEAELAVAPDIEITLPVDGGHSGERIAAPGRENVARMPSRGRPELDRLHDELANARAQTERLTAEVRDLVREGDDALAGRDRAHAAAEQLQAELQRAQAELDLTRAERDQAVVAREQASVERDQAQALLDRLRGERDWAQRAATEAAALRDAALGDLDAAHTARDEAVAEREALGRRLATLENEHAQLSSAHGAALVIQNSTRVRRPGVGWLARVAAIVGLVVVALAVLVLTHAL